MRYSIFTYRTPNLGDDVQAIAAALLFPTVDAYINRDRIDQTSFSEPHHLIMNSWFAVKRYKAVPSKSIIPHYFGQCIGRPELVNPIWLKEWNQNQPIGCRDFHSLEILRQQGIKSFYTGCLTTWMGRFFQPPEKREGIVLVDIPKSMERFIPENILKSAKRITNMTQNPNVRPIVRFRKAAELCDIVRCAEMVITRRLHTALPCVGFKTPVSVYLKNSEKNCQRFSGADKILPMVFHDGKNSVDGPQWREPALVRVPDNMENAFQELLKKFSTSDNPRWSSVVEFVSTLPDLPSEPRSSLNSLFGTLKA